MSKFTDQLMELWARIWMILRPGLSIYGILTFLRSKLFLFLVIVVLALAFGRSCAKVRDLEIQNLIEQQNLIAANDTIKMERTKSGQLEASVATYISSEKELKKLNSELYKEIQDQKGRVISLNKVIIQLKQESAELRSRIDYLETIMSQPIQINDSTYCIPWVLNYDWDSTNFDTFKGETMIGITPRQTIPLSILKSGKTLFYQFDNTFNGLFELKHYNTEITERTTQIDLTFGQEIVDDQLRVFIKTKYPGFTATSMQGWMIDPNKDDDIKKLIKKKKWIPNTFSVGIGPSIGYDFLSFEPYLGIGVNINYNLLQW